MHRADVTLAFLVTMLVGCSTPYRPPVLVAKDRGEARIVGITETLQRERKINILIAHGMCTHTPQWATGAARDLLSSLGEDPARIPDDTSSPGNDIVVRTYPITTAEGTIHLSTILWSPLIAPLKQQLCYDQTNRTGSCPSPAYPYARAGINRLLKDTILNDCLADAVIYQGKSRNAITNKMLLALQTAVGSAPDAKNIFVTDSLGSKVVFDAILKAAQEESSQEFAQRVFDNTRQIFMRANQIPILALGDMELGKERIFDCSSKSTAADPIGELVRLRNCRPSPQSLGQWPLVVAFSDPNDLLSYPLATSPHAQTQPYPFVDIIVSNTYTWLGQLERPDDAHKSYGTNKDVMTLIACGKPHSSSCNK